MNSDEYKGKIPISDDVLRRLSESRRVEAEMSSLTSRLNVIEDYKRDPTGKTNDYVHNLIQRQAYLRKQSRIASAGASDLRARPLEAFLAEHLILFGPWTVGILPFMSEGINVTPGIQGTSGQIATGGLFAGGLGYGGEPNDDGTQDANIEKWWVHNWTCSFVFPSAPFTGTLFYRFTVDSSCLIYHAPAQSGVVQEFVTIGKSGDINAKSPFDVDVLETVGWPVMVNLPQPNLKFIDGASLPVSGSIPVEKGKTAALAFIYGTIVGVASGYVQFSWANFGTRLTLPPLTTFDGEVFDKIEYRFESDWWLSAVARRLNPT